MLPPDCVSLNDTRLSFMLAIHVPLFFLAGLKLLSDELDIYGKIILFLYLCLLKTVDVSTSADVFFRNEG